MHSAICTFHRTNQTWTNSPSSSKFWLGKCIGFSTFEKTYSSPEDSPNFSAAVLFIMLGSVGWLTIIQLSWIYFNLDMFSACHPLVNRSLTSERRKCLLCDVSWNTFHNSPSFDDKTNENQNTSHWEVYTGCKITHRNTQISHFFIVIFWSQLILCLLRNIPIRQ